jgi:hypothetical protein
MSANFTFTAKTQVPINLVLFPCMYNLYPTEQIVPMDRFPTSITHEVPSSTHGQGTNYF